MENTISILGTMLFQLEDKIDPEEGEDYWITNGSRSRHMIWKIFLSPSLRNSWVACPFFMQRQSKDQIPMASLAVIGIPFYSVDFVYPGNGFNKCMYVYMHVVYENNWQFCNVVCMCVCYEYCSDFPRIEKIMLCCNYAYLIEVLLD